MATTLHACPRCGSSDLRIPGLSDGIIPETDNLGEWVCKNCGLRTIPLEFDRASDLETFRAGLGPFES